MTTGTAPWQPSDLIDTVTSVVTAIPRAPIPDPSSVDALLQAATFHLDFLQHHLEKPLFPSDTAAAPFGADSSKRYVSTFLASSRPTFAKPLHDPHGLVALTAAPIHAAGGKPVMSQSALHGFHVFEGMQLRWSVPPSSIAAEDSARAPIPRFGFAFRDHKVAKLVDGIIRLRFAVHFLKAAASVAHLRHIDHPDAPHLAEHYDHLARSVLPARRSEAEAQTRAALTAFIAQNEHELQSVAAAPAGADTFVYVRVEAQGGDRDAIGQGPIGVGQSTLQILGQYATPTIKPARLVVNSAGPPRMHTLAGPGAAGAMHDVLCNRAVHHGNMGHQHLSAELALPHGSDMLMRTGEMAADAEKGVATDGVQIEDGPFVAESNFSNVAFVYGDKVVFPRNASATYGLMQHELRGLLEKLLADGALETIRQVKHEPIRFESFLSHLRDGRVSAACVLGSMPALRAVDRVTVDDSLGGGPIMVYNLEKENKVMQEMSSKFQQFVTESVVWE